MLSHSYDRHQSRRLPKAARRWLATHGLRALLRRVGEPGTPLRTVFVATSAIAHVAATGGRGVQVELWRHGAADFLMQTVLKCHERMRIMAEARAAKAAAAAAGTAEGDGGENGDAEGSKEGEGKEGSSDSKDADTAAASVFGSSTGARRMRSPLAGAKSPTAQQQQQQQEGKAKTPKSPKKKPKPRRPPLVLDNNSRMLLRNCAAGFMFLCFKAPERRSLDLIRVVLSLLQHKDPAILKYTALAVWSLAHQLNNRRDVGAVGGVPALVNWTAVLVLGATGNEDVLASLHSKGSEPPAAPSSEAAAAQRRAQAEMRAINAIGGVASPGGDGAAAAAAPSANPSQRDELVRKERGVGV